MAHGLFLVPHLYFRLAPHCSSILGKSEKEKDMGGKYQRIIDGVSEPLILHGHFVLTYMSNVTLSTKSSK